MGILADKKASLFINKSIPDHKEIKFLTIYTISMINKKPKRLENSQLIRKTWHVNQIFELILEQCAANYYGDNTIAK